ncbi:MAG: hypothetical protein QW331_01130, partial [Candidatus Woesearchaeota archaeon]
MNKTIAIFTIVIMLSLISIAAKNYAIYDPSFKSADSLIPDTYQNYLCEEFTKDVGTGKAGYMVRTKRGKIKTVYEDYCRDLYTLVHYSCSSKYPETPVIKRCPVSCKNNACVENFGETIKKSQFLRDSVSETVKKQEATG